MQRGRMVVIYDIIRPTYIYVGMHSIFVEKILAAVVVLQHVFVELLEGEAYDYEYGLGEPLGRRWGGCWELG
jgi:hypothetical protein